MTPKTKQNVVYLITFLIQAVIYYGEYLLFLYIGERIGIGTVKVSFIQPLFFCIPMSLIVVGFQIYSERQKKTQ